MEIKLITIEEILRENEKLKQENVELRMERIQDKNWTSIREGYIYPKLKEYGYPDNIMQYIITPISNIVKSYLDINKTTEINVENYEIAKQISMDVLNSLSKYKSKGALKWTTFYKQAGYQPKY